MAIGVCIPLPGNGQYQTQWDYLLSSFPPDVLYVIGDEADAPTTNVFSKLNATYIETPADLPDEPAFVVLAQENGRWVQGEESLLTFEHPDDVIYFFGHDTRWVSDEQIDGKTVDHFVFIPTATSDDLWSWTAGAMVFWDRMVKSG